MKSCRKDTVTDADAAGAFVLIFFLFSLHKITHTHTKNRKKNNYEDDEKIEQISFKIYSNELDLAHGNSIII